MKFAERTLVLLGPQRDQPTLGESVAWLGIDGPVALVLAGQQDDECDDESIRDALGVPVVNMALFERAEQLFREDPELLTQLRSRQDRLRINRDIYRLRLDFALDAVDQIVKQSEGTQIWLEAYHDALECVRRIDRWHLSHSEEIIEEFDRRILVNDRPTLSKHRDDVNNLLKKTSAVIIGGGHVGVLLNRLRMFNVVEQSNGQPIVAWSAGAMALSDRIVLFHDAPPQGPGHAEVLRAGLGVFDDRIMLPDARRRLDLSSRDRVAQFASRFSPTRCVILDENTEIRRKGGKWSAPQPVAGLYDNGQVGTLSP